MLKLLACGAILLALAGCSNLPQGNYGPCAKDPAGYECQIERYQNVSA